MGFERFLAYSASAGSGKTYALSVRYISLLFLGESPKSILAATFTKKAASEMSSRIINFLQNLHRDENLLASVCEASGLDSKEILARQKDVIALFLKEKNYIVTLDSFFNAILRSFALEMGLEPSFEIKESVHDDLEEHFIRELDKKGDIDAFVDLSFILEKRRSKDLLTLFEELFNLEAIVPKEEFFVRELDTLKQTILKEKEAFIAKLEAIGAPKRVLNLVTEKEFKTFLAKSFFEKESLGEHSWFKKIYQKNPELDSYFFALKESIATYLIALEETILHYLFKLYFDYKEVRLSQAKANATLSFNDVLYYTYWLVNNRVSRDFIYFKLDSKFKHILLDEFQDTSSLQYLILRPLIDEIFSGHGSSDFRSFFYVGDTKQSLYRFRGGVEGLFSYVAKRYSITIKNLDTNYRSAKNIVTFTNKTFLNSEISDFVPQKANSCVDGLVEVITTQELLEKAKEKIKEYLQAGVQSSDIALLVFANKDGVALQEYLKEHGIDSILKTSSSLQYNPKIAALVGVLYYLLRKKEIYLAPFKAKIKKEEIDLSSLNTFMRPIEILDQLISDFAYFDNDANILKLLDFAKSFTTLEEFLDEFEKSNIPLAQQSSLGVEIMTIHGSKGLEFKYVIVLDRLGAPSNSKDLLLFEEKSPIEIKKIHTRHKNKESFVLEYKRALEKNQELEKKDKLNLLYVAITRAELALTILKKDKRSEFDILDLQEEKIGSLTIEPTSKREERQKLAVTISSYGKQELALREEESEVEVKDFDKIYFGEALHYALEQSSLLDPNYMLIKENLFYNYGELLDENQIDDIMKRVQRLLTHKEFQELLKGAKLFKEQTISFHNSIYQIDLLIKKEEQTIIVDYKSSKKFASKHRKQVRKYQKAVEAIEKKVNQAYLIYLLEDRIEIEKLTTF